MNKKLDIKKDCKGRNITSAHLSSCQERYTFGISNFSHNIFVCDSPNKVINQANIICRQNEDPKNFKNSRN